MILSRRQAIKAGIGSAAVIAAGELVAQDRAITLRTIPRSGEKIPPVGIGTNRYGVGRTEEERKPLRDTMTRFVELGGKVMDTAFIYGTSESVVGELVAELDIRDQLFLATKTDIRGQIRGDVGIRGSLERLQTNAVEVMLVHNFANTEAEMAVLRDWQSNGQIRYVGASTSAVDQHEQMERFMLTYKPDIVQFNYSLGDRSAANRLLPTALDNGIAVMINIPFAGARNSLFNFVDGRNIPEWAAEFDVSSWAQFFLKYIISHPAVTVAIPGTRQVQHVEDNFGAALGRLPDASERRRMEQFFDRLV